MKIVASAGTLAKALALAASLNPINPGKKLAALEAVNVIAGDDTVSITRNVLESQVTLTVPATIERPGALALPSGRLAALAAGFAATVELTIEADGAAAKVRSGRSHYKMAVVPPGNMPAPLALTDAASTELSRADALALFAVGFCAAHDARTYLCGVHVADSEAGLVAAASNGYALARRIVPGVAGWGTGIIVPTAAVKIINKLIADKSIAHVPLRHSKALLSIETPSAIFTTRLIDGTFPDYARIIPEGGNIATVKREALAMALARLAAVDDRAAPLIMWTDGEPALHIANGDDTDIVDAESTGSGRVALAIDKLAAPLDEFTGTTVSLDVTDAATPVRLYDRDDPGFLVILAPTAIQNSAREGSA
jgi:DNA polymerase-3 subunit beta